MNTIQYMIIIVIYLKSGNDENLTFFMNISPYFEISTFPFKVHPSNKAMLHVKNALSSHKFMMWRAVLGFFKFVW